MYKNLLEYIVKNLVNHPEKVEISEEQIESKIVLKLKVGKEDMGRVIGKGGKLANAVRTLVQASSYIHDNKKVRINIDSF